MIYEKLYDYQKKIIEKFKEKDKFGLFLDMGLGKTPISLGFAEKNNCNKVLIITINSKATEGLIKGSFLYWAKESNMNYELISKTKIKENITFNKNCCFIINYESLYNRNDKKKSIKDCILKFISSCKKEDKVCVIVDESHKLKNLNSLQSKTINKILTLLNNRAYTYLYLLSGTPFTKGYIDLYSQLKFLGYQSTKNEFVDAFCIRGNIKGLLGWQQPIVGYKNIKLLFNILHKYAITINSEDVVNLPEKIFITHEIKESNQFHLFTNEMIYSSKEKKFIRNNLYRNIDYPNYDWLSETSSDFWLRCRQLSSGFQGNSEKYKWFDLSRLYELTLFLKNNVSNYILFYNYTPELFYLYEICLRLDYNVDIYSGEIKNLYYYEKYEKQSKEEKLINQKNIILANFSSGSTGMNWQEYNKCIIFSLPLYKDYAQAIKRIHRLGQNNSCIYHIFYQDNFLDKQMLKCLKEGKEYNLEMFNSDINRVKDLKN